MVDAAWAAAERAEVWLMAKLEQGAQVAGLPAMADGGDVGGHEMRNRAGRSKVDRRSSEGAEGEVDRVDGGDKGIGRGGEGRATKVMAVEVRMMWVATMMTGKVEEFRELRLPSFLHSNLSASCSPPPS
mmetsp:Transcript_119262/g.166343  ORF Transcript_119262/g.166343 Transcript_119262/m.166343 type:complete len:129 (-) Transcript_119262:254-640(-)